MKKTIPFIICCLIGLSCKKEKEEIFVIEPAPSTGTVELKIDQVINDSSVVLKWTKPVGAFQKYLLVQTATYFKNGQFGTFTERIDSSSNINHLSFTENNMPVAKSIWYYLLVSKDTTVYNQGFQYVAAVSYERPNSLLYGSPFDVLIDKQKQLLYIAEKNEINIVNYLSGRLITSKEFPASIGYCYLGDFGGNSELYVPVNDGWLHILDASTLQLKDRIYVAGEYIGSVVAANGKLYVSSTDRSVGGYSDCIKVYDRATKNLIGRTGYYEKTRLFALEGSALELIDLTISVVPVGLSYYQFNTAGMLLLKKEDTYHGDYVMDAGIARSFPDGSKFITSSSGTIFNKSLLFDRYVKQNGGYAGTYSDFAFNNDGSLIYTAYAAQKKIDVVSYPAMNTVNSYVTAYYPYKIFRDGNTLICVSRINTGSQVPYMIVEKINL